jgi:hypothetical protein
VQKEKTEGKAHFIAGQPERMKDPKCNFMCHHAWTLDAGTPAAREAFNPPCDDDDVIFPKDSTYRVLAQGIINVNSMEMMGASIASKYDVPEYQLTPAGEALKLHIGEDQRSCVKDAGGNCICHTQCADSDRHREQDDELRDAVKNDAAKDLAEQRATEDRAFKTLFVVGSIFSDMGESVDGRSEMDCIFADEDAKAHVVAQLTDALEEGIPGTRVNDLTVSYLTSSNAIDIRSSNVSVMPASVVERNADGSAGQEWFGTPVVVSTEPMGPNLFNLHMWHKILETAAGCEARQLQKKVDALHQTCEEKFGASICAAIRAFVRNTKDVETDFGGFMGQVDRYLRSPPVRTDPETGVITTLPFVADLSAFSNRETLTAHATTLLQGRRDGATTDALMEQALAFETAEDDVDAAAEEGKQRVPQPTVLRSDEVTTMVVGGMLPQSDINRLVNERNNLPLREFIAKKLPGTAPVVAVDAASSALSLVAADARRRRAADNDFGTSGQAHTPLSVDLAYAMLVSSDCQENDASGRLMCPLMPGTGPYIAVHAALDDIVSEYDIITAPCYDLVTGNDLQCAIKLAIKALNDNPNLTQQEKEELLRGVLQDALDCPSGDCAGNEDQLSELNEMITAASESAQNQASGSTDSAAGVPLAAVAGAAAGVVLLIIVVVVVLRRRRRLQPDGKAAAARTVVAFENPMYDEPAKLAPEALYDDAEQEPHDEGLYDEPAFAQGKENPMYQSTEDILDSAAGGDEGEEGGYLDVAPDEELDDDE